MLAAWRQLGGLGEHLPVDVAKRHDLDRGDLDQATTGPLAVPSRADQADALGLLARQRPCVISERRHGQARPRRLEESCDDS